MAKTYSGPDQITSGESFLERHRKSGAVCPCCKKLVKEHKRFMTEGLVILMRQMRDSPYIWQFLGRGSRDPRALNGGKIAGGYNDLWHPPWELTRGNTDEPPGWWQLTERGLAFLDGRLVIPSWIATLKTYEAGVVCVRYSDKDINCNEARKQKPKRIFAGAGGEY